MVITSSSESSNSGSALEGRGGEGRGEGRGGERGGEGRGEGRGGEGRGEGRGGEGRGGERGGEGRGGEGRGGEGRRGGEGEGERNKDISSLGHQWCYIYNILVKSCSWKVFFHPAQVILLESKGGGGGGGGRVGERGEGGRIIYNTTKAYTYSHANKKGGRL